MVLRQRWCW
jgi:hypothetical protein